MFTKLCCQFLRASRSFLLAAFMGCLLFSSPVFAQDEPAPPAERGYTMQYVMAIVMTALGTVAVCRSSLRHVKSED